MNTQQKTSKIHNCPIKETTDIAYETPSIENLEKYYSKFMEMSHDQLNTLLNNFTKQKGMNQTEKTFNTVNSNVSTFLSKRLHQEKLKQEKLKQEDLKQEDLKQEDLKQEDLK